MNTLPNIVIRYAWSDGKSSHGPIYTSPHEARNAPIRHQAYPLLRLFVDPAGRIVHSEVVV